MKPVYSIQLVHVPRAARQMTEMEAYAEAVFVKGPTVLRDDGFLFLVKDGRRHRIGIGR